ncbi:MAG TPA: hypothetical protein VIX82_12010 [Solirubrobacteraceae bacterium]
MAHLYCRCGTDWSPTIDAAVTHAGDTWSCRCEGCKLNLRAWAVDAPHGLEVRTHGFYPHPPSLPV